MAVTMTVVAVVVVVVAVVMVAVVVMAVAGDGLVGVGEARAGSVQLQDSGGAAAYMTTGKTPIPNISLFIKLNTTCQQQRVTTLGDRT